MAGVYEVRRYDEQRRLYIGRATNLMRRIKYSLLPASAAHHAGRKIRAHEDLSRLCIRWADTDRPTTAEDELLQRHLDRYGALPEYCVRR